MTEHFAAIDYAIMSVYLLVLVAMGFYLKRWASASLEAYIVGGRQFPSWALGFSGMASFLDLAGTAIIVAFLFLLGPRGLFIEFRGGACLILPFMMLWMGKWHRRSGCLTSAEWMVFRFGDGFGGRFARVVAMLANVLSTIGMLAMLTFAAGHFLSLFVPASPTTCAVALLLIATCYSVFSGFYGVVFTDIFQSFFMLAATAYVAAAAWRVAPDAESLGALAERVTGNGEWVSSVPAWQVEMPPEFDAYQFLLLFSGLYFFRQIIGGMVAGDDPKYFAARNDRECGLLSALWIAMMTVRWPLTIGIAVLGLAMADDLLPDSADRRWATEEIRAAYPGVDRQGWPGLISTVANSPEQCDPNLIRSLQERLGRDRWDQKIKLLSFYGEIDSERVLPAVLVTQLPNGLRGLVVVAFLAASMSTFDSHLNRAAGMLVRDCYQAYLRPAAAQNELIYASWASSVLVVAGTAVFSMTIESINDIWSWIIMGLTGGMLGPFLLRFYWWRFTGGGFAIGTVVGMGTAIVQRAVAPDLGELTVFSIVLGSGTLGAIAGSYLTNPVDAEVLWRFYDRTRPFGLWGPMRARLNEAEAARVENEHRYDLLCLPFALLWQVSMFMAAMLAVIQQWQAAAAWAAASAVGAVGVYFLWYTRLPETNWYESPAPSAAEDQLGRPSVSPPQPDPAPAAEKLWGAR